MIRVRKITPKDIEPVLEIFKECQWPTANVLANIGDFALCESNDTLCGCGCAVIHENKCFLNFVLVKEANRRDSIGSAILRYLLNLAELQGIQEAYAAGDCHEFLTSLKFTPVQEETKKEALQKSFTEIYGSNFSKNIYEVSLIDYFKSCCCHK